MSGHNPAAMPWWDLDVEVATDVGPAELQRHSEDTADPRSFTDEVVTINGKAFKDVAGHSPPAMP